jgi:hypothetical protein
MKIFVMLSAFQMGVLLSGREMPARPVVYELKDSADIIKSLISMQRLDLVLHNNNKSVVEQLISNFSPAEMAFEAELLACTRPVLAVFVHDYHKQQEIQQVLEKKALAHLNQVKIVAIDSHELFRIAQLCDVDTITCMIIYERQELFRCENINQAMIEQELDFLLSLLTTYMLNA